MTVAASKPEADPKPKAKKETKNKKKDDAGGNPVPPASGSAADDFKSAIAAFKSEVNKNKQQAEAVRKKLDDSIAGATKPRS